MPPADPHAAPVSAASTATPQTALPGPQDPPAPSPALQRRTARRPRRGPLVRILAAAGVGGRATRRTSTRPWPAVLERVPECEPDTLLAVLEFYSESVIRRMVDQRGRVTTSMIDIAELARALSAGVPQATGVLPGDARGPNILFWACARGATRLGIWVGSRVWTVALRAREPGQPDHWLALPFPGLLFVARRDTAAGAYVFAAPARPRDDAAALYRCPAYNVFPSSKICPGDHAFPSDPLALPEEFFLSKFRWTPDTKGDRTRKYPDDIGRLWDELDGKPTYPHEDLVPAGLTVRQASELGL